MANYKLSDLARAAGITPRAVRFYLEQGLLPRPEFHSTATAYGTEHLMRLRAIARLRRTERLRLPAIKKRLAKLSAEEIAVLAQPPAEKKGDAVAGPAVAASAAALPVGTWAAQRWERIELVPGLELHMRADAAPLLVRLAQEIHAQYGASAAAASVAVGPPPSA